MPLHSGSKHALHNWKTAVLMSLFKRINRKCNNSHAPRIDLHGMGECRGKGVRTSHPSENHKNIGFPSNIVPDPLKITKLPSQHSMLGRHRHASKMTFKCGPMMARLLVFGSSLPSSTQRKKMLSKLDLL